MSLGDGLSHPPAACAGYFQAIEDAIELLRQYGTITFASSGNNASKTGLNYPACLDDVISVGNVYDAYMGPAAWTYCTDETREPDKVACSSASSDSLDLLAPGCATLSTVAYTGSSFGPLRDVKCGTSMSTPHAIGVAALLLSAQPWLNPTEQPLNRRLEATNVLEEALEATGTLITDQFNDGDPATFRTTPRVDARVALIIDDAADYDADGLTNIQEFNGVTSPKAGLGVLTSSLFEGDTDKDGCLDSREVSGSVALGGLRNPRDFWDFMDVPTGGALQRDRAVGGGDISQVVARFGSNDATTGPFDRSSDPLSMPSAPIQPAGARANYHPAHDRGGTVLGLNVWNLRPPNGAVDGGDVAAVVNQFGHNCV
jgi:subtilisin family serine protease